MKTMNKVLSHGVLIILLVSAVPLMVMIGSENASATAPTITNYGVLPTYGDVGATTFHFFLTYTDADNDSPSAGYPKATKLLYTWPAFTFVANDTGDTVYSDGKAYYYNYTFYPVIGATLWQFKVKSGADAEVTKTVTVNVVLPSTPIPFNIYPATNEPGQKTFTFNYTSEWGLLPLGVNVTIDGVSNTMTANDTGDTIYIDGKDYYFTTNLTAGAHNYSFQWHEVSYLYPERDTGEHWLILEEPSMNISFGVLAMIGIIAGLIALLGWAVFK